jgi:excisionase family DNA binding protein
MTDEQHQGEEPEFLNTEQAAKLLNVSTPVLRRATQAGEIPAARIGREYRYRRSVLLNLGLVADTHQGDDTRQPPT